MEEQTLSIPSAGFRRWVALHEWLAAVCGTDHMTISVAIFSVLWLLITLTAVGLSFWMWVR
jgi:hypothetical protein